MSLFEKTPWTLAEEDILSEVYPIGGKRAALVALPNRSADAIKNKAQGMGLCASHLRHGGSKPSDGSHNPLPAMYEWERKECAEFSAAMRAVTVEPRAFL